MVLPNTFSHLNQLQVKVLIMTLLITDLIKNTGYRQWIGFYDVSGSNGWEWSDGSYKSYTNWRDFQPDNIDHRCAGVSNISTNYKVTNSNESI